MKHIKKFGEINESLLFKKSGDDKFKKLSRYIKDNFDIKNLKDLLYEEDEFYRKEKFGHWISKFSYNFSINGEEYSLYLADKGGENSGYNVQINEKNVDVSNYLLGSLYRFFRSEYKKMANSYRNLMTVDAIPTVTPTKQKFSLKSFLD